MVEVPAVNTPLLVMTKGVPAPDKVTVRLVAAKVSLLLEEAFPTVSTPSTVIFVPKV